jgi:hypothetical protein
MKTNHEQVINRKGRATNERGNALVYVLIAIALFTALSMTFGRQSGTDEVAVLSDEKADLYATQLISYAAQTKSVLDQMLFTGTDVDELDFMSSTDPSFNIGPHIHKVYHPEGGGLNAAPLPKEAVNQTSALPPAGWYLGRFNNVDWTATTGQDVILVAYQISRPVCEKINRIIKGSPDIPVMKHSIHETMIDDQHYVGTNADLTTEDGSDICPECNRLPSLCVEAQARNIYGFYSIVADQ